MMPYQRAATVGIRQLASSGPATITEQHTLRTIKLLDPEHPEYGDYPDYPAQYSELKDPYAKYDDQQMRRNFDEPLNIDHDLYDMWSPDLLLQGHLGAATYWKYFFYLFGSFFAFAGGIYAFDLAPAKPAAPRSYPYDGMAAQLGATTEENAHLFRTNVDSTAEEQCGVLPPDADIQNQKAAYLEANKDFVSA